MPRVQRINLARKIYFKSISEVILIEKEQYDIWFKLYCFYSAKTELYDRSLTDLRSPRDKTEAYTTGENRYYSQMYAISLYRRIKQIALYYGISKEFVENDKLWREYFFAPNRNYRYSAQGWVDMYNHLVEIGEMDFIKGE